jgi:hypothetical protein
MNLDVVASDVTRFRNRKMAWVRDKSDLIAWQFRVNVSLKLHQVQCAQQNVRHGSHDPFLSPWHVPVVVLQEFMAPSEENDRYLCTVWPVYLLQAKDKFVESVQPRQLITPPPRYAV